MKVIGMDAAWRITGLTPERLMALLLTVDLL